MVQPKLIAAPTALGGGRGMQQSGSAAGLQEAAVRSRPQQVAGLPQATTGSATAHRSALYTSTAMAQASHILWRARRPCRKQHLRRISRRMPLCAPFEAPRAAPPGRASVVWAGVGGGPCGDEEMKAARDAVCKARAERQQIMELRGAKPYSRHSHMLA